MGSIFGVFLAAKIIAKIERIFERIFWDLQGWAVTIAVACLRPKRPLGMALGRGKGNGNGMQ